MDPRPGGRRNLRTGGAERPMNGMPATTNEPAPVALRACAMRQIGTSQMRGSQAQLP